MSLDIGSRLGHDVTALIGEGGMGEAGGWDEAGPLPFAPPMRVRGFARSDGPEKTLVPTGTMAQA